VDLSEELLLLKGDAFLFKLKLLGFFSELFGCIGVLSFSSFQLRSLKLEGIVDLEELSKVSVQSLYLNDCLSVA
jgi:hypothetical protein